MKCPSCGASLDEGARFCGVCGSRLEERRASASGAATVPKSLSRPPVGLADFSAAAPAPGPAPGPILAPSGAAGGLASGSAPPGGAAGSGLYAIPGDGADPYLGQVLNNRFRVESKLGEGGFGAVYRGTQLGIGRKVALKLLHPEMTRDQNLLARFRREGVVLCSLRDAHTITTYDFDQTPDGTLYIAMELLEGVSLHEVFHHEAPIPWPRMLKIASEMCSSLDEAHKQGIVHRDLKPENIYLEKRPGNPEFVKILDFGIAKVMRGDGTGQQSPQLTATGQTLGTLEYMSPEQLMGKPLDGRSDVYAVGVLSYELITARLPFPDAVGPAALISAQLRKVPDPPSVALPGARIPPGVDHVILKALEKDRKNRFNDVMELQRACEQVLASGGQVPAIAASVSGVVPMPVAPAASAPVVSAPGAAFAPMQMPAPVQVPPTMYARPGSQPAPMAQGMMAPPLNAQVPMARPPAGKPRSMPDFGTTQQMLSATQESRLWLWIVLLVVAIGGGVGAYFALK
jgi:serine/threonine-protein kinase